MRALAFDGARAALVDRPEPALGPDAARVRVALAGVCRTDLELCRGYMGFRGVLGHEFVGRVVEGPAEWRGERVVGEINLACGRCPTCGAGLGRHCPERTVLGIAGADGAFAESVSIPVVNLHRVPDGVPDERAVFTEPLAAAFEVLEQVDVAPGTRCLVLGDGKLGLLVAQVLAAAGAEVTALGRHPAKLAILERRGIATALADRFRGAAAPLVVEATGSPAGFRRAVELTAPRGTLVLKSTHAASEPVDLAPLVIHEIHVVGSRCGPFPPALRALERGEVEVDSLVSERAPLTRAAEALARAAAPGVLKVLIDCS
ncbi:MAG TPA: alcohol dehydrogenase catalytic domain-containing protein [Myxococcota bacterium]|nr:alcohol dehydrogenase catalytic domain-containing protein [Myxococcota bacterium]